ncbi:uncharacterized protein [Kogia breviceps]|uniref:uncharacterized protein n=1 Tax=Kogia breviceps TaxID=27615 RepID=UPI0034D1A3CC
MEPPEEEAEAGPGFEAPAGCGGGGYPRTNPRSPPRPLPAASTARPGAGSRGRAGSPGRRAAAGRDTFRSAAARGRAPQARPEEGRTDWRRLGQRHLYPSEGGRSGAGEAPHRETTIEAFAHIFLHSFCLLTNPGAHLCGMICLLLLENWVPEGEEREKGHEKIFEEIINENFPNMGKEIATQVQKVQRVPVTINPRRNMLRHIVIKLIKIKDKEKLLKPTREK